MTRALTFRPATAADAPALRALIESAYRGETARAGWTHEADLVETPRTSTETLAAIVADPSELLLMAFEGRALAGCVQVTRLPPDGAYFGLLTVDPARQAAGLGKRLIEAAEAEAASRFAARSMELTVISKRPELIAYYQRRGYALTGEERPFPVDLDPPLTLLVMRKALPR